METRTLGFHAHPPPQRWVRWGGPSPGLTVFSWPFGAQSSRGGREKPQGPARGQAVKMAGHSGPPTDPPAHLPQLGAGKRDSGTLGLPEPGGKHGNKTPGVGRWDLGQDSSALEKEIPSGFLTSLLSLMHMPGPTCLEQGTLGAPQAQRPPPSAPIQSFQGSGLRQAAWHKNPGLKQRQLCLQGSQ